MNIFTIPYSSKGFYARPDTSLNRDSNDYFCPDGVTELAASVFVYAKAAKAGKCIASKFASRYYSVMGKGIHFSAPSLEDGSPENWWISNSLDSTTFITEEYTAVNASSEEIDAINNAFEKISGRISLRTGDIIAIETSAKVVVPKGTPTFTSGNKEINIIW